MAGTTAQSNGASIKAIKLGLPHLSPPYSLPNTAGPRTKSEPVWGHESLTEIAHYKRGANKKAMILRKRVAKPETQQTQAADRYNKYE